jgi:hypothetical protein
LEQTASLDALAEAAARLGTEAQNQADLREMVRSRWAQLIRDPKPEDVDNYPGVTARLLELTVRCGLDLNGSLQDVDRHPMRSRILYQFVHRLPESIPRETRGPLYAKTLELLRDKDLPKSVAAVAVLLARDIPDSFMSIMRGVLREATGDDNS